MEYRLWWGAKNRAKKYGIEFNLQLEDIVVPEYCPLLGIKLIPGQVTVCQTSPTVDRIIPSKGYIKGNVWVISEKANRVKSDLSLDELKQFVAALERKIIDD